MIATAVPQPAPGEKLWGVLSPELIWVEPILDDGTGPMEQYRDFVYVTARTKRQAITAGLRLFRAGKGECQNLSNDWWNDGNPFSGMKAEVIQPCPTHRYLFEECMCDAPDSEAP